MSGLDVADGLSTGSERVTLVGPLLAQSGHYAAEFQCPLLGVKRTWRPSCAHRDQARRIAVNIVKLPYLLLSGAD